jgi:hypothetical protein
MNKSVMSVETLKAAARDSEYWARRSPEDRLRAMELMRQVNYGYDPSTARLQRVLEVARLERG